MILANNIKKLLALQGKKQAELADYIGVKQNTVSDWINKGRHPSTEYVYRMAEFFNVSFDYLFTGNPDSPKDSSSLGTDEQQLLQTYNQLDDRGKTMVKAALYKELDRVEEKTSSTITEITGDCPDRKQA